MKTSRLGFVGLGLAAALLAACSTEEAATTFRYYVYMTEASSGKVSAFSLKAGTGALSALSGSPFAAGTEPQSVAADPSGKFLYVANYFSDNISAYAIDAATGGLTAVTGSPFLRVGTLLRDGRAVGQVRLRRQRGWRQRLALFDRPGHRRFGSLRLARGGRRDPPELRDGRSVGQVPLRGQ